MEITITAQTRFQLWLEEACIELHKCFDWQSGRYCQVKLDQLLNNTDEGTASFICFALGVWHHDNRFDFDIIDAISVMSEKQAQAIMQWIHQPFWP